MNKQELKPKPKPEPPRYILVYACDKCGERKGMDSSKRKFPISSSPFTSHKQQAYPGSGPIDSFWHCGVFQPFAVYKLSEVKR